MAARYTCDHCGNIIPSNRTRECVITLLKGDQSITFDACSIKCAFIFTRLWLDKIEGRPHEQCASEKIGYVDNEKPVRNRCMLDAGHDGPHKGGSPIIQWSSFDSETVPDPANVDTKKQGRKALAANEKPSYHGGPGELPLPWTPPSEAPLYCGEAPPEGVLLRCGLGQGHAGPCAFARKPVPLPTRHERK